MKILKNIVFWLATTLVVIAIALVALPMIGGLEYLTIISGSMEPEIPVGSLIFIEEVRPQDIEIGDVVTFSTSGEITVTHKVIGYELSQDALITHGVGNADGVNEITPFKSVVGRVVFSVPVIGRVFLFISTSRGKVIAVTFVVALYILSVIFETIGSDSSEDEEDPEDTGEEDDESSGDEQDGGSDSMGSWLDTL